MADVPITYPGINSPWTQHPYSDRTQQGLLSPFQLQTIANASEGPGAYSDNMWYNLESLQDVGLQMALAEKFRISSVYGALVPTSVAMRTDTGAIAESMTFKGIFGMEPNYSPVGRRQIWFSSNYTDTYEKSISFLDYADKVALHRYDDLVQAYLFRGSIGMQNIARTLLGESVTIALDLLARNAFLDAPFFFVKHGGTITANRQSGAGLPDFSTVESQITGDTPDAFDVQLSREIWRQLSYLDVPMAANPGLPMGNNGTLLCVTTPDAISAVKDNGGAGEWYTTHQYAQPGTLLNYEIGAWDNTRFMSTRRNVLWNCGDVVQTSVLAPSTATGNTKGYYGPGDGGSYSELVDKVYRIGQNPSAVGVQEWLEVDATTGLTINDIVTIHKTQTSDFGVTDGVDFREEGARVRRIVGIDTGGVSGARIKFDKPLFSEFVDGDFVTKARHIHASVYVAGPGVVNGVGEPIMAYPKEPIDDANAIWRFIWQGRFRYQLFQPEFTFVFFHGGQPIDFGIGTSM